MPVKQQVNCLELCVIQDLKDDRRRDDIAAARATLKKNSVMLLTTSKVCYFRIFCYIIEI